MAFGFAFGFGAGFGFAFGFATARLPMMSIRSWLEMATETERLQNMALGGES